MKHTLMSVALLAICLGANAQTDSARTYTKGDQNAQVKTTVQKNVPANQRAQAVDRSLALYRR